MSGLELFSRGASRTARLDRLIQLLDTLDARPRIERLSPEPGDVQRTYADISKGRRALGTIPAFQLRMALNDQFNELTVTFVVRCCLSLTDAVGTKFAIWQRARTAW